MFYFKYKLLWFDALIGELLASVEVAVAVVVVVVVVEAKLEANAVWKEMNVYNNVKIIKT